MLTSALGAGIPPRIPPTFGEPSTADWVVAVVATVALGAISLYLILRGRRSAGPAVLSKPEELRKAA
ncbi:MAG: hypothetical protein ACT4PO_10050 [Actinomycetota bacterium]